MLKLIIIVMNNTQNILSHFAQPKKPVDKNLMHQKDIFKEMPQISLMLNAVPDIVIVLNSERKIVFANKSLADLVGSDNVDYLLGLLPGEALNCAHAFDGKKCGTTEFCSTCGANNAIMSSQNGAADIQECRIIQKETNEALDLRVWTTPFEIGDEKFTIFAVKDISDEKRRKALERIFFHDILNTAGALKGIGGILEDQRDDEYSKLLNALSDNLIEDIKSYRELTSAEEGDLIPQPEHFSSLNLVKEICEFYKNHIIAKNENILISDNSDDVRMFSDKSLLKRVIVNMLKNALEASKEQETVVVGCNFIQNQMEFWVHEKAYIPVSVQLQIFQRSFSTKAKDRGLGTYSMRLLTERYLQGNITFRSDREKGTTFKASYPLQLD